MVEALSAFQDGTCRDAHSDEPLTRKRKRIEEPHADTGIEDDEEPWKPLIHNDLKLSNVFCASGNEKYPLWPRIIMADFDLAQPVDDIKHRYIGTPGWQPPVS
jgi:serine/threonine protein kinase